MTQHEPDAEVAWLAALPVSVLADALDRLGRGSQAMEHRIRPVDGGRP